MTHQLRPTATSGAVSGSTGKRHTRNTPPIVLPLVLSVSVALSACGNGSSSKSGNAGSPSDSTGDSLSSLASSVESNSLAQNKALTTGTIVIEERGGRTVFDGWFSDAPTDTTQVASDIASSIATPTAAPIATPIAKRAIGQDVCRVIAPVLGAANNLGSVGQSITIESRIGEFDSLSEYNLGDTTVYAQEERWQSQALPEDAVLSFENITAFAEIKPVQVPSLLPLVWTAPENGIMSNPSTALQWEPSFDENALISLRLSAVDYENSSNPQVVSIACDVVDDGLFTLPADFQQQLPTDHTGIVVYAVRERVQQVSSDDANLTVKQLSYPKK